MTAWERLIGWFIDNRLVVPVLTALLIGAGLFVAPFDLKIPGFDRDPVPVDAIPDIGENQQIVFTKWAGRSPQDMEDQVTYPLTTAMLSVPGAVTVRGYSFFGDSYVYIIFNEKTDLYWARSRVLEYLSQVAPSLPDNARPQLGPDATGVGWVYLYALVDRTGVDPAAVLHSELAHRLATRNGATVLSIRVPFADRDELDLTIADLIAYRQQREQLVERTRELMTDQPGGFLDDAQVRRNRAGTHHQQTAGQYDERRNLGE